MLAILSPHSFCGLVLVLVLSTSLTKWWTASQSDPWHCDALINRGRWLDAEKRNWQPEGCMFHRYKNTDAAACLARRRVVFAGDSITRSLFFSFMRVTDPFLPSAPPSSNQKHSDYSYLSAEDIQFEFVWDPFLNGTSTVELFSTTQQRVVPPPFLLVLGSGLWYLRYLTESIGLASWQAKMEMIFASVESSNNIADHLAILPVETLVRSKLSDDRASTMKQSDIDAMNTDLMHRMLLHSDHALNRQSSSRSTTLLFVPFILNSMLPPSQTDDGLHYADNVIDSQAHLLLNRVCNDALPKTFPLDKTCCRAYPKVQVMQACIAVCIGITGPLLLLLHQMNDRLSHLLLSRLPSREAAFGLTIFGLTICLMFLADRTNLLDKEQKQFDPISFAGLAICILIVGFATVTRSESLPGFLNRDQTEEWKGWMQLVILIYHYFGASQIPAIYNPIRVLVASYLFMTGYGHCSYYLKKADFGLPRVVQVLVRLNLLTVVLAYVMNTNYFNYYFSALVSFWFMVVYLTMAIGHRHNDKVIFIGLKILVSGAIVSRFFNTAAIFDAVMDTLHRYLAIHWSAHEVAFRVNLDMWIVYVGMMLAICVNRRRNLRFLEHQYWPRLRGAAILLAACVMGWYCYFELTQESKYTYNMWHPYISALPILSFVALRNATEVLRSSSSRAFIFIGKCSLETFIMQYHIWLAADTKGILFMTPFSTFRSLNFIVASTIFLWLSHSVAGATAVLTRSICERPEQKVGMSSYIGTESISEHSISFHLPSPSHGNWTERLSAAKRNNSAFFRGQTGLGLRLLTIALGLWVLNVIWG